MKKIIITLICILALCGCIKEKETKENSNNDIKQKIVNNFTKITKESNMTSSNPYDYTTNKYYINIINIGEPAVPVLEKMYKNKELSGIESYISALAIQEITKCNLYEKYNIDWSNAEEFYNAWETNNCSFKK